MGFLKRSAVAVLIATSISADASAWGPPVGRPDVESEIAWARATWPDVFKGVRFQMPLATLLAWVPRRGSIPAYLHREPYFGTGGVCVEVKLERNEREGDDGNLDGPPTLIATIASPIRIQGGRQERDISFVSIGVEMSQERASTSTEARDVRGRWKFIYGTTAGEIPATFGWLSYADDRVARWDAQPLALDIQCQVEWFACPASGGRPCQQCERALVVLQHIGAAGDVVGHLQLIDRKPLPPATCQDLCPSSDSPDIARLRRLDERIRLWRPRRTPLARVSSLYRSLDDCLHDHPGRAAGTK